MTSQAKIPAPEIIHKLVETFEKNLDEYRSTKNETELRRQFLDKFFAALGWDVANDKGYDESHKEVVHEFSVEVAGQGKKADYAFRTRLRAHLRIGWPGVIVDFRLAPANVHELQVAEELFEGVGGWALGDRNYWKPELAEKGRLQACTG